jgi:hypothetical protein
MAEFSLAEMPIGGGRVAIKQRDRLRAPARFANLSGITRQSSRRLKAQVIKMFSNV